VGWPHGDPRAVARAVLSDPRFHVAQPKAHRTIWNAIGDALRTLWNWLVGPLRHATGNRALTTAIGLAVLAALVAGAVWAILRFARVARARAAARGRAAAHAAALEDGLDAAALYARALDALAAGRLREAAALLWSSALRALDERGRVAFDPSRSPGEWRRAVRDPAFDALARDAVVALFGDRDVDAALVKRMRESYARVAAR